MQSLWNAPKHVRHLLERDIAGPRYLRVVLDSLPVTERDVWWDRFLFEGSSQDPLPDDGRDLPRGCAPYLPCNLEVIERAIELLDIGEDDIFVDVGSGLGRVGAFVHFLTGAAAIGIEIQQHLVREATRLRAELRRSRMITIHGDAAELLRYLPLGTVYFLYCPCGGARLERILSLIEYEARHRSIRVCCVDMAPIESPLLAPVDALHHSVRLYESSRARSRRAKKALPTPPGSV